MDCPECDTEMERFSNAIGDKELRYGEWECPKCGYEIEEEPEEKQEE